MEELKNKIKAKEKELLESGNRMNEYKRVGAKEQLAQEESTYYNIVSKLKELNEKLEALTSQEVLFEGVIGEGMLTPEKQFENATGEKFNNTEYEIIWSGADGKDYTDTSATPFKIVKKVEKSVKENSKDSEELAKKIAEKEAELRKIAERRAEYKRVGAYDQQAMEDSNYEKLSEEIQILKAKQNKILSNPKKEGIKKEDKKVDKEVDSKDSEELAKKIAEKEAELRKIAERRAEYKRVGAYDQQAMEDSNYEKLSEEIQILKAKQNKILSNPKKEEIKKEDKKADKKEDKKEDKKADKKEDDISEKIKKKEEEVKAAEKRMANFGTSKFDGQTELAKYKKLMKELEELKKEKQHTKKENTKEENIEREDLSKNILTPTQEEINRYINLINKGYDNNSPEMQNFFKEIAQERGLKIKKLKNKQDLNKNDKNAVNKEEKNTSKEESAESNKKYEIIPADAIGARDAEGNLKYPLVPQQTKVEEKLKLSIVYNGKDNQYEVSNIENPIEAIKFKNKKSKLKYIKDEFTKEEIEDLFGNEKNMKKMMKVCDPQLLVLLADQDMEYAQKYINKLSKGKNDEKEELPYDMKYNLKGMKKNRKNNDLTFSQRRKINKMAKKNHKKGVAEYIPDDKSRKWLVIPVIGALAAGGLAIANNEKAQEKTTPAPTQDVTDTTETKTTTNITKTQETTTKVATEMSEKIENTVEVALNSENQKNNNDDFVLGSKVNMQNGITYTEDSLGNGVQGKIGEISWRPAGEYTVDRVAIYYNGKLLENLSTEGTNVDDTVKKYAEKLGINPSEIEQKAHICMADKHQGATGWINMDEMSMQDIKNNISKTYEQIQQENNAQQNQNSNQEQNHEDR